MTRKRRWTLIIGTALLVLGGALLWALPEIVRRVVLDQIPKRTGRAAAIEDIDLNLFTGRLAVKRFRLADRGTADPFVEVERLDLRLAPLALLRSHLRVVEVALAAPSIRLVRTGPAAFNFSDLVPAGPRPAPEPAPAPSRWTVTVERLAITGARVWADDRAVTPPAEWLVQDLALEATGLTTRPGAPPGRAAVRARIDEARLAWRADRLGLDPLRFDATLTLDGFETQRLEPYVFAPLGTPYRPRSGRLGLDLAAHVDSDAEAVRKAALSGTVTLKGEALVRVGRADPFLSASELRVEIREADALARSLAIAGVTLAGLDLHARRDARGAIDLVEIFTPKRAPAPAAALPPAPAAAPGPAPPPPRRLFPIIQALGRGFETIRIERITLAPGTATFVDEAVTPVTTLALTKLQARLDGFTWPVAAPAALALSTELPGGGTLNVTGPLTVAPFDADLTVAIRRAPVQPYQAYIPVPARLAGRFGGDSRSRIAWRDGRLVAASRGNSWGQDVQIRGPGDERPAIRVERMDLVGVDFEWPTRAVAARIAFRRPRVEIERAADGSINVRRLFTPAPATTPAPAPPPRPSGAARPESKGPLDTMRLEFGEVRIEDGAIRFLDRTTTPAFSEDLSRLELTLTGLGNRPDRRARLVLQSLVGGDASLDIRGEIGPIGAPVFVDLVGELRSFKLSSVDPYAEAAIGWVIKQGELQHRVRFKLAGDQLTADNDLVVGKLQVAPSAGGDEVKQRLGLPLGLIVALIKDQQGDIRVSVPIAGPINDPRFDFGDAIWTAIKNVLVNIVTAPFKALGRLFSGGGDGEKLEEPRVAPVTFAPGSSVLSPAMEEHLLRVADFLRRSPFVNLRLAPVSSPADADALKDEALAARLRDFQKARGLADPDAALAAYYREQFPGTPPPAPDEQRARLREREPAPAAGLEELARRRVEATRERLLATEGIPAERLAVEEQPPGGPGPAAGASGEGGVELGVVAGG